MNRYPIVIEKTATGYSAYSPDVPGCAAVGDTKEQTRQNFQEALVAHFEAMREGGEQIPEQHALVRHAAYQRLRALRGTEQNISDVPRRRERPCSRRKRP